MTAIYYPKLQKLSYWDKIGNRPAFLCHYFDISEQGARTFLREHIIRTEVIQSIEVFKS